MLSLGRSVSSHHCCGRPVLALPEQQFLNVTMGVGISSNWDFYTCGYQNHNVMWVPRPNNTVYLQAWLVETLDWWGQLTL